MEDQQLMHFSIFVLFKKKGFPLCRGKIILLCQEFSIVFLSLITSDVIQVLVSESSLTFSSFLMSS